MATDTLVAGRGVLLNRYQLRVLPLRRPASTASPTVRSLQAVASRPSSRPPGDEPAATARPGTLERPALLADDPPRASTPSTAAAAQAWCSPTSLSMILGYYRRAAGTGEPTPGCSKRLRRPLGRPRRPGGLRLRLRRRRQLGVQHRLRRRPDRRRVRHPAGQPARGRAVHRRRHPAGRLDRLRPRPAHRRPDQLDRRPPRGDHRLHQRRRRRRQRPRRADRLLGAAVPTTAASSSGPGCAAPAAPSTSSATPPTRFPPGRQPQLVTRGSPRRRLPGEQLRPPQVQLPSVLGTAPVRPRSRRRRPASGR